MLPERRWWWLPLALLFSLALHLVVGEGVGRYILGGSTVRTPAFENAIEVSLVESPVAEPVKPTQKPRIPLPEEPLAKEETPERPRTTPRRAEPVRRPVPNAPEAPVESPQPLLPPAERPAPRNTPVTVATPTPAPQPTPEVQRSTLTTGNIPDRAPRPLPRGDRSGSPEAAPLEEVPRREEAPVPDVVAPSAPETSARIQPNLPPRREPGAAGGGGDIPFNVLTVPRAETPKLELGERAGSGGGREGGVGQGEGPGTGSNDLGISRGIPFGDILGLTRGGDPTAGGGYRATGPGGTGPLFGGGGQPRFSIRRPSGGGPPVHIVYVLDVSGSMLEGNKMSRARDALIRALEELRPEDSFNIVSFSDEATLVFRGMRPATNAAISAGRVAVNVLQPRGQTNLSAALDAALTQQGVSHIFVLSDGEPTRGITNHRALRTHIQARNGSGVRIITLALILEREFEGTSLLKSLAADNNGRFEAVDLSR